MLMLPAEGASFNGARLKNVMLIRSAMTRTHWRGAVLDDVQIIDLDMADTSFGNANLSRVCFLKVALPRADFREAVFANVSFIGDIDLTASSFNGVKAQRLAVTGANLDDAEAIAARMDGAYFGASSLARIDIRRASLKQAILSRNNLSGADFFAANLFEAQLNRADATGTSFRSANLFGADLMDATLAGADLNGANLKHTIMMVARDVA
jgi:uncharacterized protein YjbI with pentapeptide repeats